MTKEIYYYARDYSDIFTDPVPWSHEWTRNIVSLIIGLPLLNTIVNICSSRVEGILLHNFEDWSLYWLSAGQDSTTTRLERWQLGTKKVSYVVSFLMRWPGWSILQLHLWQCVGLVFGVFAGIELLVMLLLQSLVWSLWLAQRVTVLTGWAPPRYGHETATPEEPTASPPASSDEKSLLSNTPMQQRPKNPCMTTPSSWTAKLKQYLPAYLTRFDPPLTRTFEYDGEHLMECVYQAISAQPGSECLSFEELHLQEWSKQQQASDPKEKAGSTAAQLSDSVAEILAKSRTASAWSWMKKRSFSDSAFSEGDSSGEIANADVDWMDERMARVLTEEAKAEGRLC